MKPFIQALWNRHQWLVSAACLFNIVSCSPISRESFYQETKMQNAAGMSHAADIVGRWYDAWDWNGHRYTTMNEFKKDGTGTKMDFINWRTGGGIKTVADLRWSYKGNGTWNVVESNKRTLAGSGRFSAKPFTSTVRVMNRRLYDDTRQRTAVNANDSAAVADKDLNMKWTGEARAARNQQIQELGQAIDGLRSALSGASAATSGLGRISPPPDGYRSSSIPFGTQTTDITANYREGYAYDVTTYGGQYATDPQDFITIYGVTPGPSHSKTWRQVAQCMAATRTIHALASKPSPSPKAAISKPV